MLQQTNQVLPTILSLLIDHILAITFLMIIPEIMFSCLKIDVIDRFLHLIFGLYQLPQHLLLVIILLPHSIQRILFLL